MKDLYTFDIDSSNALNTYTIVQKAYAKIFKRIGVPFMVVCKLSQLVWPWEVVFMLLILTLDING